MSSDSISILFQVDKPRKISGALYKISDLPRSEWKFCGACNGTGSYYSEGDLHRSPGYIPCSCSGGKITTEAIMVKKPVYRVKAESRRV